MRRKNGVLSFGAAILLLASTAFAGQIIYVDADAAGVNDGSSWADALTELQEALGAAVSGDQIWVAEGTYLPDYDAGTGTHTGNRSATFRLQSGVGIYGGFPSGGGTWQERDPNMYETILSGDLNGDDVEVTNPEDLPDEPTRTENSYHIATARGTDETAVLDGFTITAGKSTPGDDHGGGMYNKDSSPTVTNCTFRGNLANYGGGMGNYRSSAIVTNCTFSGNSVYYYGGGMSNYYSSSPTLTNCTFIGNSAGGDGGGMFNYNNSSPTLRNCSFNNNSAIYSGGGMKTQENSSPTLTNCTFSENSARYGGGMENSTGSMIFTNCIFNKNSAEYGGGMDNSDSSPTLINCSFSENLAEYKGGGIKNAFNNGTTIINCRFSNNSAEEGGGIFNESSSPILRGCTFSGNRATFGGGMYQINSSSVVTNCTFSKNVAISGGGMRNWDSNPRVTNCIFWGNTQNQINDSSSVTYCNVQGGWSGEGNIDADPLFVEPGYWDAEDVWIEGDYRLQEGSPCIDAGDPNYIAEPNETDMEGNPRILDGDEDGAAIVDMGAYEFVPAVEIEADLRVVPRVINLKSRGNYVMAIMRLPEGIAEEDIDEDKGFTLEPGEIDAFRWRTAVDNGQVSVFAIFERQRLKDAITETGELELTVAGYLTSGQSIYGMDTVRVIKPPKKRLMQAVRLARPIKLMKLKGTNLGL